MRRPLGALLAIGLAAPFTLAADPPAPSVEALVARLGADSFAEREEASRALWQRGPAVLDALTAVAATHPDPETRQRAAALVEQLKRTAETARLLAPKTVKLDYRGVPLGAALADLRTKTGVPLTLDQQRVADPLRPVTVKTDELPAWEAIEAFRQAAGLREVFQETLGPTKSEEQMLRGGRHRPGYVFPGQPGVAETAGQVPVVLADGKAAPLPGDRSTAVRVLALPAAFPANRVVRGSGQVVFNLDVTPLPGVKWDDVAGVRVLRAEDETGRPITGSHRPEQRGPAYNPYEDVVLLGGLQAQAVFFNGDFAYTSPTGLVRPNPRVVPVVLRTDDRAVRRLRVFEGVVVGEVTLPNQPLAAVAGLPKSVGTAAAGPNDTRYTVLDYKALPDGRVSLKVRSEGPNPWTQQRLARRAGLVGGGLAVAWEGPIPSGGGAVQFKFADAAGKPIPQPTVHGTTMSDDGVRQTAEVELVFPKRPGVGAPATMTVVGNKTATVEVPFRMRDVILP
jgi:hypothetical protein